MDTNSALNQGAYIIILYTLFPFTLIPIFFLHVFIH